MAFLVKDEAVKPDKEGPCSKLSVTTMAATDEMSKHISCGSQTLGSQHLARHHAGPGYSGSAADPNQPSPPWPSRRAVQVIEAQHPVSLSWEDGGLRDAVAAVLDDRDNGVKFTMACPFRISRFAPSSPTHPADRPWCRPGGGCPARIDYRDGSQGCSASSLPSSSQVCLPDQLCPVL